MKLTAISLLMTIKGCRPLTMKKVQKVVSQSYDRQDLLISPRIYATRNCESDRKRSY
jgi:hypothetical protein